MLPTRLSKLVDRKAVKSAFRRVFESPDGRVVLRHLMHEGFVLKSTFVGSDPHETALNEGSRRLVLSIIKMAFRDDAELNQQIEEGMQE